ncbi:MAG: TIGR01212 family radical SAM protein [Candidatus Omnitrophota bacterium]
MKLYNDYSSYLKEKYGCKVHRIGLDAGFSCPNRDGTRGEGGCLYCNNEASRSAYVNPADSIAIQLKNRIAHLKETRPSVKFIAYFQAFTNTYAPVDKLKAVYDNVLAFDEIVGISIGTRPDAIDDDKLKLISSYLNKYEVWIEYGLQSIHDRTLKSIKRGHTYNEFLNAFKSTKAYGIPVCVHIILGLPGETKSDMIETARRLTDLKIDAVKIHLLHVLKGSPLEKLYSEGRIKLLTQEEYVNIACDFLENLSSDIIIQRLTGEGTRLSHIAPAWALDKIGTIDKIREELTKRKSHQGYKLITNI